MASIAYMTNTHGPGGAKGFMPHARAPDEEDGPEDVGRVFEALVRVGEIDDSEVLICTGSYDVPRRVEGDPAGWTIGETDVRARETAFSYGWTRTQQMLDGSSAGTMIAADRGFGSDAAAADGAVARNHPDGANVLRFDGSLDYVPVDVIVGPAADSATAAALRGLNLSASVPFGPPPPSPPPAINDEGPRPR